MIAAQPCPFCGSDQVGVQDGSTFRWRKVVCYTCEAAGPEIRVQTDETKSVAELVVLNDSLAIDAWNARKGN